MKIWNYIMMAMSMILFFHFLGWTGTDSSPLASYVGINMTNIDNHIVVGSFDINFSSFKSYIFDSLLVTLLGSVIVIGFFVAGQGEIGIKAGVASALFVGFIPYMYLPITKALELNLSSWATGILTFIFGLFSIGFLVALVEWVFGGD